MTTNIFRNVNELLLFVMLVFAATTEFLGNVHAEEHHEELRNEHGEVCLAPPTAVNKRDCATKHSKIGLVDPYDIAKTTVYKDWTNKTIILNGETLHVSEGSITWPVPLDRETKFSVLPGLLSKEKIDEVLSLIQPSKVDFDNDLDSVDAMPTREIFVHEGDAAGTGKPGIKGNEARQRVRRKLRKALQPIEDKITAVVRQTFPQSCNRGGGRSCRPCFSLIRRYLPGGRRTHNIHRDGQALVTAVMSFSDYGRDFLGGLYVAANGVGRQVIALRKGDVILHRYDLLHGVQVDDFSEDRPSVRWSWILWFKDHDKCEQRGYEWSESCAKAGDALCQYLQGWRVHLNPKLTTPQHHKLRKKWMTLSAMQGFGEASFKVGRANFEHSNMTGAVWWLQKARAAGEADASYQLGHIVLNGLIAPACVAPGETRKDAAQREALALFEEAAMAGASPYSGAQFAMYNIGVAWLFGFAGLERNPTTAARWFNAANIPEALMAYSLYLGSVGEKKKSQMVVDMAKSQGFPRDPRRRDQPLFGLHGDWPKGPPQW